MPTATAKHWWREVAVTGSYSVQPGDSGTLFTTAGGGAVQFNLPPVAAATGCFFWFYNVQNYNLVVAAPAGKLIAPGNAAGSTCTYQTAGQLIGAHAFVWANDAGSAYVVANLGGTALTVA
jgi:hypothetical protein